MNLTSSFARCFGGIRTTRNTHDFADQFNDTIRDNPTEVTGWLLLADRLQEAGEHAHHAIRFIFTEGYKLPEGFTGQVARGARYWEGGSTYYTSARIEINADGVLSTSYYCGGWCSMIVTREQAVERLTVTGDRHVGKWCDLEVTGSMPATVAYLDIGTEVDVETPKGRVVKNHKTTDVVAVPLPLPVTFPNGGVVRFKRDGFTISVNKEKVKATV